MPSTFFGLNIGYTGLNVHQGALHTTAHNITNAETQGYSRQYLARQAGQAVHVYSSYGMVGTGVVGTGVYQIRDSYYDEKYRTARTVYGEYSGRSYYMAEVQSYFNEINNEGFTTNFSGMFTSLEELAKDPASGSARRQAINSAMALTEYFNNMSTNLKSVQEGCNFDIKNTIDRINSIGEQLATINKQINVIEVKGVKANDLRDQRNLMIDELSELVNISVEEVPMGAPEVGLTSYAVKVNGTYLVNDYQHKTIEITPRDYLAHGTDIKGIYDLNWDDGQDFDLYGSQLGGKLAALVALRDGNNEGNLQGKVTASAGDTEIILTGTNVNSVNRLNIPEEGVITVGNQEYKYTRFEVEVDEETGEFTYHFELDESKAVVADVEEMDSRIGESVNFKGIPYYLTQMNEFIRTFAKAFNDLHKVGEDLDGNKGIDFFNGTHPADGTNYKFVDWERTEEASEGDDEEERENAPDFYGFSSDEATYYKLNADNFTITRAIWDDEKLLAAAGTITQGVEEKKVLDQLLALKDDVLMFRQGKPESFFQTWISDVGIDTSKADDFTKSQQNIMESIENQRLSISGVDTDEEAMDLIRFQKAYDLSSKVISVMDEIYNKLINEMAI